MALTRGRNAIGSKLFRRSHFANRFIARIVRLYFGDCHIAIGLVASIDLLIGRQCPVGGG